jgi:hypothetical protein
VHTLSMDEGLPPSAPGSIRSAVTAARTALSNLVPDTEIPSKPDSAHSPRCLAFHPRASELACGDRQGNLRVYSVMDMSLKVGDEGTDQPRVCALISRVGGEGNRLSSRSGCVACCHETAWATDDWLLHGQAIMHPLIRL